MPARLHALALYGVPLLTGVITVAVLLGSGGERPAIAARVYGYVGIGSRHCAMRVHVREHRGGAFADFAAPSTVRIVAVGEESAPLVVLGEAKVASATIADVVVPLSGAVSGPLEVVVRSEAVVLARGRFEPRVRLVPRPVVRHSREQSDATLSVGLLRGFAVAELPERLVVAVDVGSGAAPTMVATAAGAQLGKTSKPVRACQDDRCVYTWTLAFTPRAPSAEVDIVVLRDGAVIVGWAGPLDVVTGRMWLDPDFSEALTIRSAVARDEAYLSLVSPAGRFWGTRVPLTTDDAGISQGSVATPALPQGAVVAVVSGEPHELESASASWPLRGLRLDGGRVSLLADGMVEAVRLENDRRRDARRPAYGLIVASGIFEIFYLWWRARRSRRRLEVHLAEHTGGDVSAAQSTPLAALVLISGALALAFAILATLSALS